MNLFITNSNEMNFRVYHLFNIVLLLTSILGVFFLIKFNNQILPKYLTNRYDTEDYLANLQNPGFGFNTFFYRDTDFDYIVIGDSHVYSGFNYNVMSEVLETDKIGSLSIGGMGLESIPQLFSFMDYYGKYPKNIILGMSIFMVTENEDNINRINEINQLLKSIMRPNIFDNIKRENIFKFFLNRLLGRNSSPKKFKINYVNMKNQLDYHTPFINQLNDRLIENNFSVTNNSKWRTRFSDYKFIDNIEGIIKKICFEAKKRNIKLYVIHIPESPLIEKFYPIQSFYDYQNYLSNFDQYSQEVIVNKSEGYNINNKHFINRFLDNIDYNDWEQIALNYDHLSYFGAVNFTHTALFHLRLPEKKWNYIKDHTN